MRTKLVLGLAIVMGAVTTILFYQYMARFQHEASVNEAFVEVITAKEAIAKNERVTDLKLAIARVPQAGLHPNAVKEISDAVGKLADSDIAPGEVLMTHRLEDEREEALLVSRKVQEGYRAVSVGVNFVQTVSNLIEPEDKVDVIFSKEDPITKEIRSEMLLTDIRVLAVGRRMLQSDQDTPYVEYSSATLEIKPEQLLRLVQATESGSLHLALHTRVNREASPAAEGNAATK